MPKKIIYAEDAIKAVHDLYAIFGSEGEWVDRKDVFEAIEQLPSAQPYTEEELRVFQHGISLILLSKQSSQHWKYDEDTATEIKFLERLYEKVGADIRGKQNEKTEHI